ncbi:MAG: 6-phosphofructokinase [Phycisphaerales bacterium]|nr:6-phosphofructokinase [Phycisphaerales bacterium]
MSRLAGHCVVAQSGGPTAVINASVCGVIQTALKHPEVFTGVYGANHGILGVLNEDLFDLGKEDRAVIDALKRTPSSALGTCRYKLKSIEKSRVDYERIVKVFKTHDIRYFFYAGGNDSMDTADKISQLAGQMGYDLVAIGVPKTIDNDLPMTDHCPGFGSAAKYAATSVMEAGRDTEAISAKKDYSAIVEIMGRHAGWLAAATGTAHRDEKDAPHLVYLPEVAFSIERFIADVRDVIRQVGFCVIAVGEGIRDDKGKLLAEVGGQFAKDAFGHTQLGGASETLREIVENEVGIKCRTIKLGNCQRQAMHFASLTDVNEAWQCGAAAVEAALAGHNCKMVTLVRGGNGPEDYSCSTGLADLSSVANHEKLVPRSFINQTGNHITQAMRDYVMPLMRGQAPIDIGPDGLPIYPRLRGFAIPKKVT